MGEQFKPENESESFHFKTLKTDEGTFGVFEDYPDANQVLEEISKLDVFEVPEYSKSRSQAYPLINIGDKKLEIIIKGKASNGYFYDDEYPHNVPIVSLPNHKNSEDESRQRQKFSAFNELLTNRKLTKRYKEKFQKELLIEKPIGYFISTRPKDRGARWVIFEKIKNIITVPPERQPEIDAKRITYAKNIYREFKELGLKNNTAFRIEPEVVAVGDIDNPQFVLIDSEEWQDVKQKTSS